jgi:hypothetical protein
VTQQNEQLHLPVPFDRFKRFRPALHFAIVEAFGATASP